MRRDGFARSVVALPGEAELRPDEGTKSGLTAAKMASFLPSFAAQMDADTINLISTYLPNPTEALTHRHHPATSPRLADGAALLLLANAAGVERYGFKPLARLLSYAEACDDPVLMLTGHIKATETLLQRANLTPSAIDCYEVNESFAASVLKYCRDLKLPAHRVNPSGGALCLGHPLGATGAILLMTLIDNLRAQGGRLGVAAIPAAAGMGAAALVEIME